MLAAVLANEVKAPAIAGVGIVFIVIYEDLKCKFLGYETEGDIGFVPALVVNIRMRKYVTQDLRLAHSSQGS